MEHGSITRLIEEIQASSVDDPLFDSRVHVLCGYVAHHVEEEEGEMFAELLQEEADMKGVVKAITAKAMALDEGKLALLAANGLYPDAAVFDAQKFVEPFMQQAGGRLWEREGRVRRLA